MLMRKSRVQTVGFKLEDPYLEQLEKSARALKMSPGLYARRLVIQSLMNIQLERMEFRLDMMQEGMAAGFEKLLTQVLLARNDIETAGAGEERSDQEERELTKETAREAHEWVRKHVRQEADGERR